jgi:dihydroorotase
MLLITNGRVLDPASGTDARLDLLLDGPESTGCILQVGRIPDAPGAELFDAAGLVVAPGFFDLHCHLREPGDEHKETIASGTRAAARGGFTAVCCMPNTRPVNDNASVTRAILERAAGCGVRVWPVGAVSAGSQGESLAQIAAMREAGIVAVSDDGRPVATSRLLRSAMEFCRELGLTVIDHCEDSSLSAGGSMREGPASLRLGLRGIPACAESVSVARGVEIAALTGGAFHVAHLSCRASLDMVRAAKQRGLRVTCEVTPHHFTLCDEDVRAYDTRFKMNPPLASRDDRDALIRGLADGSVDAIATDHAPHDSTVKDVEFDKAAYGITGLETALALALRELVQPGLLPLMRLVELFTTGPARVLGPQFLAQRRIVPGAPADLTIFSPDREWVFRAADSASKSRNTPFDGWNFRGGPVATIVAGRIVYRAC